MAHHKTQLGKGPGSRPHLWKYPDPTEHRQSLAFQRMRCQARYREEAWELTFEEFKLLWKDHWAARGRASNQYCLTRIDPSDAWRMDNIECLQRVEYLTKARK